MTTTCAHRGGLSQPGLRPFDSRSCLRIRPYMTSYLQVSSQPVNIRWIIANETRRLPACFRTQKGTPKGNVRDPASVVVDDDVPTHDATRADRSRTLGKALRFTAENLSETAVARFDYMLADPEVRRLAAWAHLSSALTPKPVGQLAQRAPGTSGRLG